MARFTLLFIMLFLLPDTSLPSSEPSATTATRFDYRDALEKSLLFFEAQRSGKLPLDQRVKWRGDSGLQDGFHQGVDLVGGYYDAGDHIKFGFPMAFAVTMLSWGVIEFEREIEASGQLEHTLDAIQWGTDYFIKAHNEPNVLWGQVGESAADHACWERAEDMTTPRTAYRVDTEHPGSDIAGETAAALAAASIAFRQHNSTYSDLLLLHAKQLFLFADMYRGRYDDSIIDARAYYPSGSGYDDELLWGATWLFQASKDNYYLNYVLKNGDTMGGTSVVAREFSWQSKYVGLQVLLVKILMKESSGTYNLTFEKYKGKVELFLCACLQKNGQNNIAMTPGGLLFFNKWSNMQYVSLSAFLLLTYSTYLAYANAYLNCPNGIVQPFEIQKFAQFQVDYILGRNPNSISYLVGYHVNYPAYVHHRGASIPSISVISYPVGCIEGFKRWFEREESNPNIIVGALVGGPNQDDEFYDERSKYDQNEPSLTSNAPLIGLLAKLDSISSGSGIDHGDAMSTQFMLNVEEHNIFELGSSG